MSVVIADTSPLNYLIVIGHEQLLRQLYGEIVIPTAVLKELQDQTAPAAVKTWADNLPDWITVAPGGPPSNRLQHLDPGERAAIELAVTLNDCLLLIDDLDGRRAASGLGIRITGTLGVLKEASLAGLLDFETALQQLTTTNFHISAALLQRLLDSR